NKIAQTIGLDPIEIRRKNFLKDGILTATSQEIKDHIDMGEILGKALELSRFEAKRSEFTDSNRSAQIKRGVGIATFFHGAGFTSSGERYLASVVKVTATQDGTVSILTSSTEIG